MDLPGAAPDSSGSGLRPSGRRPTRAPPQLRLPEPGPDSPQVVRALLHPFRRRARPPRRSSEEGPAPAAEGVPEATGSRPGPSSTRVFGASCHLRSARRPAHPPGSGGLESRANTSRLRLTGGGGFGGDCGWERAETTVRALQLGPRTSRRSAPPLRRFQRYRGEITHRSAPLMRHPGPK